MNLKKISAMTILALAFGGGALTPDASAALLDVRVAWAYDGIPDPGSYYPNPVPADFNELKGTFANQNQTAGDNAANLHSALSPYGATGVGVTWANWRRFNSNDPGAFSADRDWVDRAGSGSQLSGNDDGSPTNASVTFTGLTPNSAYQVETVLTGIGGSTWDIRINSLNANHSFTNTQNTAVGTWNATTNGSNQRDWLVWDSALSNGSGSLTINFATANNAGVDGLHAIRLVAVPEPGTYALLAIGAGLILLCRRSRI